MYKEVEISDYSKEIIDQLPKGAFLTVKKGDRINTMTIGWGSIGVIWGMPIFTVLVRYSRYTYELIENAEDFTVSFPSKGDFKQELSFCGSKSGRDIDKIIESSLELVDGKAVNSPVIGGCSLYVECKIVYKQPIDKSNLDEAIKKKVYSDDDYHVFYYGEIKKVYIE